MSTELVPVPIRSTRAVGSDIARSRLRSAVFGSGDCLFLLAVSSAATYTMHLAHEHIPSPGIASAAGMVAAMIIQSLLAFSAAPVLGSIESAVPSMIVAMVSPMAVCALHLAGHESDLVGCLELGAAFGAAMFLFIGIHGWSFKRRLRRTFPRQ